jgi:hypothetical protein
MIRTRRIALGYKSQEALATAAASSTRMVADAERGIPVGAKTKVRLERALLWEHGSIDEMYSGGKPTERHVEQPAPLVKEPTEDNLTALAEQIRRRLDLIPDVYSDYGPDAARAAVQKLSEEMAALQRRIADAATPKNPHNNSPRHAS